MADKGYVYVLTNPSFKEDWVKIGKSARKPEMRSKELYNTAVPLPYKIYATLRTTKYSQAERNIHRSIDRISNLRVNPNREFFNISPGKAYEILCDIAQLLDDGDAEVKLYGDNIEVDKKTSKGIKKRSNERFDFYTKGMKDGDTVNFTEDESITATVANSRQVLFEGKLWYLSPLAKALFTRKNKANASGAYQGPLYFSFQGKKLTDIELIKPTVANSHD